MIIYFILIHIFFVLLTPFFIFIFFKQRERYLTIKDKYDYWIHCSSVGEVKIVKSLIDEIEGKILITTFTESGKNIAKKIYKNADIRLLPFDLPFIMYRSLKNMGLKYLIIVECEFWPSLIYFANKRGAKVIVINGRINTNMKTLKKFLIKIISKYINYIFPAGIKNRENLISLGFPENKIGFTENLKFDVEPSFKGLREDYVFKKSVVVFGSIREGEERIVIDNLPDNTVSIIAPRHLNRVHLILKLLEKKNIKYNLFSNGKYSGEDIVIVDEIGVLVDFYKIADIVFIGGTIVNYGGHNPIEAAYFGKPILAGRFTSGIDEFLEDCVKIKGCMRLEGNFKNTIENLLMDKNRICEMGQKSKETILKKQGSKEIIIKYIKDNQ